MRDLATFWLTTFSLSLFVTCNICFSRFLSTDDTPHFLEKMKHDVTKSNLFPESAKEFLNEKEYRFLVISNAQHHNTNVLSYAKLLSVNTRFMQKDSLSYMAVCGRLLIGDGNYHVIVIEVDNCLDDLMDLANVLRNRFPHALIIYLSPWNPKMYLTEVTNELGNTEYKDVATMAQLNRYWAISPEALLALDEYKWTLSSDYNAQKECLLNVMHGTRGFALIKRDDRPMSPKTDNEVLFSRIHLYSDDWCTLNQSGEDDLARGIVHVLEHMDHPKKDKLGEWPPVNDSCRRSRHKRPQRPARKNRRPRRPRRRPRSRTRNNPYL